MNWKQTAIAAAAVLSVAGVTAYAQTSPQQMHGSQGMMGGYGQGYGPGNGSGTASDFHSGYHMGPGMMGGYGGYGMGPGMMGGYGGYGMGPGMMGGYGGYGMGPGMMGGYGGYGMGPGMMGGYDLGPIYRLNLNEDQRKQLSKIEDDLRKKNWDLMGKMQDEMSKLRDSGWSSDKRDRNALLAANKEMFELRQQMLINGLDAQDKAESLLTSQQKEQYKQLTRSRFDSDNR